MTAGGAVISSTGRAHRVAKVYSYGTFLTACGLEVGTWQGWGKPAKKLSAYPPCPRCPKGRSR